MGLVSLFFLLLTPITILFETILLPLLCFRKPSSDPWLAIRKSFPTSILTPNKTSYFELKKKISSQLVSGPYNVYLFIANHLEDV